MTPVCFRVFAILVFASVAAVVFGARLGELCDNDDKKCEGDNTWCHIPNKCNNGVCRCEEGYWLDSSKGKNKTKCVKDTEEGMSCESSQECGTFFRCRTCPENFGKEKKSVCLRSGISPLTAGSSFILVVAIAVSTIV